MENILIFHEAVQKITYTLFYLLFFSSLAFLPSLAIGKPDFPPGSKKDFGNRTSDFHVSMNWLGPWYYRLDENSQWKIWQKNYGFQKYKDLQVIQWKRNVEIPLNGNINHPLSAMKLWWDGNFLGSSGHPSQTAKEEKIESRRFFTISPQNTHSGLHELRIFASYHGNLLKPEAPSLEIAPMTHLHQKVFQVNIILVFLAGSFLITAILQLLHFTDSDTRISNLVFSGSFLACACYILFSEYWKYTHVNINTMKWTLLGQYLSWAIMMTLAVWYWMPEFNRRAKRLNLIYCTIAIFIILPLALWDFGFLPYYTGNLWILSNEILTYSMLALCFWHDFQSRKAGNTSDFALFAGLLVLSIGVFLSWRFNSPYAWAIGLSLMITFIILAHARRLALYKETLETSRLRAARLELELLKKNIQPHFLLNSLSSIMAWMEEEPKNAKMLVTALGKELRMLLQISQFRTISLQQEIELCRAHLKVMELRQDKTFSLEIDGPTENYEIPPLVLHTLVENGLTHGYIGKSAGKFQISIQSEKQGYCLSLFNDSKPKRKSVKINNTKPKEGTGLRYVRFRLEEAFPGSWQMISKQVENGWQVDIRIQKTNELSRER